MERLQYIAFFLLLTVIAAASTDTGPRDIQLAELSLAELERHLTNIDAELEQLASYTLRTGTGPVGYRSTAHEQPNEEEWIQIELEEESTIDQIVLVPTLYRDPNTGLRSEGFPAAFRILAGTADTSDVVATFSTDNPLLPRIAPLTVSFQPTQASWIRIEVTTLTRNVSTNKYLLQLSEVLVFSKMENVALHQTVLNPNPPAYHSGPRHVQNLTDGFNPFLMDAASGESMSKTSPIQVTALQPTPTLSIDLKTSQPINQINLHSANMAHSIPMNRFETWGVPRHVRATGANHPDFSDQTVLFEYQQKSIFDFGPIIMQRFPEKRCRYIQIKILDHRPIISLTDSPGELAFSEIEILSQGKNCAKGLPVILNSALSAPNGVLIRLTDGFNYYGQILPMREWMKQLSLRHELEALRPLITEELTIRYDRQKHNLTIMQWLAALLAAGTIIIILIEQVLRQRAIHRTRERIAANLHDELGASLHAIGLFGDLAKQEARDKGGDQQWDQLVEYVDEIRSLTEHTGKTARYCTNMLEAKEIYTDLVADITRTAEPLKTGMQHDLSFENEEKLGDLPPRQRIGLVLFYKECITNIIRHSSATYAQTCISADKKEICLTISDNGKGVQTSPASLKRRARLLKGKLSIDHPAAGGTKITLRLRHRFHLPFSLSFPFNTP